MCVTVARSVIRRVVTCIFEQIVNDIRNEYEILELHLQGNKTNTTANGSPNQNINCYYQRKDCQWYLKSYSNHRRFMKNRERSKLLQSRVNHWL